MLKAFNVVMRIVSSVIGLAMVAMASARSEVFQDTCSVLVFASRGCSTKECRNRDIEFS